MSNTPLKVDTAWVRPPSLIGGLDHLGTQAPCVLIYGQLLPGITNVTDRARYYSFYPWLIWSIDQRYPNDKDEAAFVERFRRADCLFTLIAEHHAQCTDRDNERHGTGMVGRQKLVGAVQRLDDDESLKLSSFTAKDSPQRYFLNRMGGLGQYYAGTLADLGILEGTRKPWYRFTSEIGKPLAEAFDKSVPSDDFWTVVDSGQVCHAELEALDSFCPCALRGGHSDEHKQLIDIYFDRKSTYNFDGIQRKRSLALIQRLAENISSDFELTESVFRAAVYGKSLSDGVAWSVPDDLASTRENWHTYVRNDLFSVTAQTIFGLALNKLTPQLQEQLTGIDSVEEFARAFVNSESVASLLNEIGSKTFGTWLSEIKATLPDIGNWESGEHEISLAHQMMSTWGYEDDATLLVLALRLIAILVIRDDKSRDPYEGLAIAEDALLDYPINLGTLRSKASMWDELTVDHVVYDLVVWCMNTHLRISLRKLHRTGQATFRFRTSERGLCLTDGLIPTPSHTAPRFRQALQILLDMGALVRAEDETISLSAEGKQLMETASG